MDNPTFGLLDFMSPGSVSWEEGLDSPQVEFRIPAVSAPFDAETLRRYAWEIGAERSADVVAVPSRNEPFGIVILEAWSAHKPVVSTKRGGPAEFVWHEVNGLQVDDTVESVAWGLGTLLADHNRCRWMGRNGRAAVDAAFSWDNIAEQTEEVYASVA